jgi:hypothetical protein
MVTHTSRIATLAAALGAITILSLALACDKVPLLAPTGSVITLIPTATSVPLNGTIQIIATVIENGVASAPTPSNPSPTPTGPGTNPGGTTTTIPATSTTTRAGAGTPVQNGTLVTFASTIGTIEPREARTSNGQVTVTFTATGQSGAARITAYSGGASATIDGLLIGSAAAKRITVTASRQTLPSSGGQTEVLARVEDEGGSGLPGIPVTFTTTAGTVSPTSTTTDATGVARTTLTSTTAAEVTATSGATTAKVSVGIGARSGLAVSASPSVTGVGVPVTFTVTTSSGQVVTNARIDYGDGDGRSLGTISGTRPDTHVYQRAGNYSVTVTGTDATGNADSAGASVSVGGLDVTLTASPAAPPPNTPVTYVVNISGVQVDHYEWTFDDGTTDRTSGRQVQHSWGSRGTHYARVDVIGVGGALLGSAQAVVNVTGP